MANIYKLKEVRNINRNQLHDVLVNYNLYTLGDNGEYGKMWQKTTGNIDTSILQEIAIDIYNHSDIDDTVGIFYSDNTYIDNIKSLMYIISECCHSYFIEE